MLGNDSGYSKTRGVSNCCTFTAGYRFKLDKHPNSEVNGPYILTKVRHSATQQPGYLVGDDVGEAYTNSYTCIPHGSGHPEFRPALTTSKPRILGTQTAYVVGPAGEEIFTDEYGRIKAQFMWDRDGENDAGSSCWLRVSQAWAGNRWGMMFIPRIGMEVVVHFENGDPDHPIVTGCVYNPQTMPPYELPAEKTKSTIKSDSSKGGKGFNEIRFEDLKGEEQVFFHAEKDMDIRVKNDRRELIGNDRHLVVNRDKRDHIKRDEHRKIDRDLIEHIERDYHATILGKVATAYQQGVSNEYGGNLDVAITGNHTEDVTGNFSLNASNIVMEADTGITLKVGGNFITISSAGIFIKGTMVMINSGGAAIPGQSAQMVPPLEPEEAHIADNADPGDKAPTYKQQKKKVPGSKKPTFTKPTHKPKKPSNKEKKSFIEIELKDQDGNPAAGERYRITLPDGKTLAEGTLDAEGYAKVSNIDPGTCKVTFPRIDKSGWNKK